jgi:hypothetical protein
MQRGNFGWMCANGTGVPTSAANWPFLVDKGHAQAQTDMGAIEHRGGGNGAKEALAPFDPPESVEWIPPESVEWIGMADPTERNSSQKDGSAPLEWDNDPHAGSSLSLCKHPLSGNGRQLCR